MTSTKSARLLLASAVLGAGILAVPAAPTACACSCAPLTTAEAVQRADLVVHVTIDTVPASNTSAAEVTYTGRVVSTYKGDAGSHINVVSAASGASCGLERIEKGKDYLLYARGDSSRWTASLCDGTTAWSEARGAEVAKITGEPKKPANAAPTPASSKSTLQHAVPVLVGVALLLGFIAMFLRRQRVAARAARRHLDG